MNKADLFPKKTIRDVSLHGKTVLMRADYNVPLGEDGSITSDFRITQSLPTINYLLEKKCKIIIISHLGRPEGRPNDKYSLGPVAQKLHALIPDVKIAFSKGTIDDAARLTCIKAKNGEIVILENLRFNPGEEANDSEFAQELKRVANADYFVQDGFGVVHRAHASTEAIAHLLPALSGLLLEKEVSTLKEVMESPRHPLVAVVGGAKISDKIDFIEKLLKIADHVLIGGAMANTFLKCQGNDIGKSVFEEGQEKKIATILQKAKPGQIILPTDAGIAKEIATESQRRDCSVKDVKTDEFILDIGFETMRVFSDLIQRASTVIWNGTLGYAEIKQFTQGSDVLARAISSNEDITSVIGGGDTADFTLDWLEANPGKKFTHISTGGGASLELMSGMKLPGIEALLRK